MGQKNLSETSETILDEILFFTSNQSSDSLISCLQLTNKDGETTSAKIQTYKNTKFIVLSDSAGLSLSEEQLEEAISKVKEQNNPVVLSYQSNESTFSR